ncbi:toxin VasX [Achromobacter xylosoxidans]
MRLFDPRFDPAGLPVETYFVRVPAAGYLYVLKQDKTWDGYLLDKKGYYRKIPVAKMPEDAETTKPLSEACSSEGTTTPPRSSSPSITCAAPRSGSPTAATSGTGRPARITKTTRTAAARRG